MNHLDGLNKEQKGAVEHTEGPLLIVAGAGAGKTKTITHRMIQQVCQGVFPINILAVTFTNKAAGEMRERTMKLLEEAGLAKSGAPLVTTFHALSVRLLREFGENIGIKRSFVIWDRDDSIRSIKAALKEVEIEQGARPILGTISRKKSEGVRQAEFASKVRTFYETTASRVWEKYEAHMKEEGALDFDDLLLRAHELLQNTDIRSLLQKRWTHITIDEYQDTNAIQYEIARLLTGEGNNICVVGDLDQCLTAGTLVTMADGDQRPIESLETGDVVLANHGSGEFRPSRVEKMIKHRSPSELIRITTETGKSITSTSEHMYFAGYRLGLVPQTYFTYLMWKRSVGWRLGVSQVYTKGQRLPMVGFVQRCNHEHADGVWIVGTHDSMQDARVAEYTLSLTYSIPTIPFVARTGTSTNGYVHDQGVINRIFHSFDTEKSAKKLLQVKGLHIEYPHHAPRSKNSSRRNIVLTLCAAKRLKTPMHLISMVGNDEEGRDVLKALGLSVRPAKQGSRSWRFETLYKDYGEVRDIAERIQRAFPEARIIETARLGGKKQNPKDGNSLPFLPASSVMTGMALFSDDGGYDIVKTVERVPAENASVYDLNIAGVHNFIANGIVTHNCIYTWRQARLENLLLFEKSFPGTKVVVLEQNYRSTQTILTAANAIIEKNLNRHPKRLFTDNPTGDPIVLASHLDEQSEARYVAQTARELLGSGVKASEIAVLYRENFLSRGIEEQFIRLGIPYRVLGTRFFDRAEVKDVLSYLRASLNPSSRLDVARAVGSPSRGIGKTTLEKLFSTGVESLPGAARAKVNTFFALLASIKLSVETKKPSETIALALSASGMEKHLKEGDAEDQERLQNVRELVSLAVKYDDMPPQEGIERLLEDAALMSDQDSLDKSTEAISLMTVHASKGLEFDAVIITGLEQGLFPSIRMNDETRDPEEERRLFYVALTRARHNVYLTYASSRLKYGSREYATASEFIEDIDPRLLKVEDVLYTKGATGKRGILDMYEDDETIR